MKKLLRVVCLVTILAIIPATGITANAAQLDIYKSGSNVSAKSLYGSGTLNYSLPEEELPSSYSSADMGYLLPIRNQESTLNCWAFSGLSAFETLLVKNNNLSNNSVNWFSPSHLDAWGTARADGTGWQRTYEKSGGYPYIALGYLTSWSGPLYDSAYPVHSPLDLFDENQENQIDFGVTGAMYLDGESPDTIKKCIKNYGSVVTSYNHLDKFYSADSINYYCPGEQTAINGHNICVVGWDDNYSKDNFIDTPENNGAWLCRNTWGVNNDIGGYFWISYEDKYIFSSSFGVAYCYTDFMNVNSFNHIYQNEKYGATYSFYYLDNMNCFDNVYINLFDFEREPEYLDKIVFQTESVGAQYTLYYIPTDSSGTKPSDDKTTWRELGDGTVPYSGYICDDIDNIELTKGKACIGVEINTEAVSNDVYNCIGVDEWLTSFDNRIFTPDSKSGVSFIYYNGQMQDVMDYYKNYLNDEEGGNLVIKAITTESAITLLGDANCDKDISVADATTIQKYISKQIKLSAQGYANSDYNQDDGIDVKDATAIQKYLVNKE